MQDSTEELRQKCSADAHQPVDESDDLRRGRRRSLQLSLLNLPVERLQIVLNRHRRQRVQGRRHARQAAGENAGDEEPADAGDVTEN